MKTKLVRSFLVIASLTASAFAVAPESTALDDPLVPLRIFSHVNKGMSPTEVQRMIGVADATVGREIWIYWNFDADNVATPRGWDTLVIQFTDGRVSTLRLAPNQSVRALLATRQQKPKDVRVAGK
jgi:hypothetical protein